MEINPLLILASNSPRRKHLLTEAGFDYTVEVLHTEEDFPETMPVEEVPEFLAEKKARKVFEKQHTNCVVLAADTVVILDGKILNKPNDSEEAFSMLRALSGRTHEVITGVCLLSKSQYISFSDSTLVTFTNLTDEEIWNYIQKYHPFDKAGAYGAQDWVGLIAIQKLEGSYFNVMGLPIHLVYKYLK